ncbi:endo-1,4-beta-xylanase [Ruminococcus sp.]|uniref:endo-1,4-beta-xylanase n=1 Tax=Ruminococcus sp. TaxID=41978 RepID=UPI002CEF85B3|nr:endo-1,4-beta-xylanase [Ruminococcus sp.]HOH86137.1 endo-1,4-beta-xylanase [Ruminococcus sp.]
MYEIQKLVASLTAASCLSGAFVAFPEFVQRTYAASVVSNDFERNYDGWYGEGDTVELTAQPAAGADMSRGMKVSGRASAEDGAASSKGLYLFGGDKYDYSVKVFSNTAQKFSLTLLVIDEETEKETTVVLDSKNVPAGQWTELKNSYTAPEGSYEFKVKITTDSTDDFFFDDFLITGDKSALDAHAAPAGKGLKDEFADYFRVGNIFNGGTIKNSGIQGILLKDCNAIECENETKPWDTMVQNGSTNTNVKVSLNSCAAICDFCVQHGLGFRGHTLVWHSQTHEWFFKENFSNNGGYVNSSTMDQRMESYIKNMFNAYATQYPDLDLYAYDVCNEVIYDGTASQGGLRPTNGTEGQNGSSAWVRVYGNNSFVEKAFTYARQYAPPTCKLFYNDYNEFANDKQNCIINTILKPLMAKGLIDGMGMQSHLNCAASNAWGDTNSYLAAMDKYLNLGLDVQVTELDLSRDGGYTDQQQADKYKAIFKHCMDWNASHPNGPNVTLVQVWGPNDNNSWVGTNNSGQPNYPLLYDGNNQPKSAYNAITSLVPDSQWGEGLPYKGPGSSGFTIADPEPDSDGYWFHSKFEGSDDNWVGRGSASVSTSGRTYYEGKEALLVQDREASWNGAAMPLNSRIFKPGEEYSFSVNACYLDGDLDSQEFKLTLQYNDADNEPHYDQIALASAPKGEWVQLANTNFKIPSGATDVQIYVETTTEDVFTNFYIDDAVGAPAGTVVPGAGQPHIRTVILGDVNFDECIDSMDMVAARRGLLKGGFDDSMTQKAADVDQNRTFEVADLVLLQQYILAKISEFPVNKPQVDIGALAAKFGTVNIAESWKKNGENNPLYTQRFGADPGWLVYDGRLYVYTTADEFAYKNGQMIENDYSSGYINCLSTADLVNWTDHGQIPVAKTRVNGTPIAKWANNAWAPDAAWKKINGQDKFFLYFANNGSGIGVITADDPTFTKNVKDPLGHELISRSTPNSNVTWLFDPGVYYDPDTDTGIIAYGGGVPEGQQANTKQGRIAKLGDDMISIVGTPIDPGTPYLFEDSSMIKIGNTWYYSFCHNWNVPGGASVNGNSFSNADIGYMTSTDPLKGYQYQGVVFKNTGTQRLDNGGNNHHSIIEFKGSYYVLYHSRQLEMRMGVNGGKGLNYRSPCIDKATISNGKITCNGSQTGVSQLENLDPTKTVRASTMSNQSKGISVSGVGNAVLELKKGEWAKVSKVDFSKVSGSLSAKASSKSGAIIKVCAGSATGEAITYIEVPAGGSMTDIETPLANIPDGASDIYFVANGDVSFDSWSMS